MPAYKYMNPNSLQQLQPVTRDNLEAAMREQEWRTTEGQVAHAREYCIHRGVSAALQAHLPPRLDLGLSGLEEMCRMLGVGDPLAEKEIEDVVGQVVEAMAPSNKQVTRKVAALLYEFGKELHSRLDHAFAGLERQKTFGPHVNLPELADGMKELVASRCFYVPRPLTGGELLDILHSRRHLPWTKPAEPDWRIRPSKNSSRSISCQSRLSKLLKSLGIYSEENLELGLDWAVNFGFPALRGMAEPIRRPILRGDYVHVDSVIEIGQKTSGPKLLTNGQPQSEAKPEAELDGTATAAPTPSPITSPPTRAPIASTPASRKRAAKPKNDGKTGNPVESTVQHTLPLVT